jgi:hypothetical protein
LHKGRDLDAYRHALAIAYRLQELVCRVDPEGGDYVTIVAAKGEGQTTDDGRRTTDDEEWATNESQPSPDTRLVDLENQLAEQGEWARSLEREIDRKDAEIARLDAQARKGLPARLRRVLRHLRH